MFQVSMLFVYINITSVLSLILTCKFNHPLCSMMAVVCLNIVLIRFSTIEIVFNGQSLFWLDCFHCFPTGVIQQIRSVLYLRFVFSRFVNKIGYVVFRCY